MINKYIKFLRKLNIKTIYFNFKYLPVKKAIKFPFLISKNVFLLKTEGEIILNGAIRTGMVQLGYGKVGIFDRKRERSIWQIEGTVIFNGSAYLGHGTRISVGNSGVLNFGSGFRITAASTIISHNNITFGRDCLISWDCLIMDTDFHKIYNDKNEIINLSKAIVIGHNVWVGCRSTILKGSKISNNSIIGCNSQINKDISDQSGIFGGNPLRHLKGNVRWEP